MSSLSLANVLLTMDDQVKVTIDDQALMAIDATGRAKCFGNRDKVFRCSARLITSASPVFTVLRIKNEHTHPEVPGRAHLLASLHELRTQARQ